MRKKAQRFDPRQVMHGEEYEVFHYLDPKTMEMDAHYHDFYEVFVFIDGEADYWIEGSIYHLRRGDILLINPTELHKPIPQENNENYERIVLWINKAYLSDIWNGMLEKCFDTKLATYKKVIRPNSISRGEILSTLESLLKEYYSDDLGSKICAYGLLLQTMTLINRVSLVGNTAKTEKYRTSTLITEVIAYIGEHYNENLSLEMLAKKFFVSKYYLSHEFSKALGTSVYRYITLKRLNMAREMLSEGISAGQVSSMCGFGDYTNFFRSFKAEYGVSPTKY